MGTDPRINIRRFNLVSDPVRERLQDEFHSSLEIPNIPAVVVDVIDSMVPGGGLEPPRPG